MGIGEAGERPLAVTVSAELSRRPLGKAPGMSVVVILKWDSASQVDELKYWALLEELGTRQSLPEGCEAHVAGGEDGEGFVVTEIWTTPEQFQTYAQNTLGPAWVKLEVPKPEISASPVVRALSL